MRLSYALSSMLLQAPSRPKGYLVHFEKVEGTMLHGDYFPEVHYGEHPILDEGTAWMLARLFANGTVGRCVNIYVINASDFTPVPGYQDKKIVNRYAE